MALEQSNKVWLSKRARVNLYGKLFPLKKYTHTPLSRTVIFHEFRTG